MSVSDLSNDQNESLTALGMVKCDLSLRAILACCRRGLIYGEIMIKGSDFCII